MGAECGRRWPILRLLFDIETQPRTDVPERWQRYEWPCEEPQRHHASCHLLQGWVAVSCSRAQWPEKAQRYRSFPIFGSGNRKIEVLGVLYHERCDPN